MIRDIKKKNPILWLNSAHLVNDIYTGILNPIMPFIAVKLGISMAFATIILSMSHIFSLAEFASSSSREALGVNEAENPSGFIVHPPSFSYARFPEMFHISV